MNFCAASAARCCALRPLANREACLVDELDRDRLLALSGWINSCLSVILALALPQRHCQARGKTGMRPIALLIPALLLAACNRSDEAKAPAPGSTATSPTASPAASPLPAAAAVARKVSEANDLYTFDYGYPAAAAAIPSLKAMLDADLDKQKGELSLDAKKAKADAAENDFPFNPYSRGYDWQVVTETSGWLSLSSMVSTYTGGAHPNYWFDTVLWDKAANKRRDPKDLFVSRKALARPSSLSSAARSTSSARRSGTSR